MSCIGRGGGEERVQNLQHLQLSVGSIPCTQALCACVSNLVAFNLIPGVLAKRSVLKW